MRRSRPEKKKTISPGGSRGGERKDLVPYLYARKVFLPRRGGPAFDGQKKDLKREWNTEKQMQILSPREQIGTFSLGTRTRQRFPPFSKGFFSQHFFWREKNQARPSPPLKFPGEPILKGEGGKTGASVLGVGALTEKN